MGSLKSPCATSYRSSIETIALNCLVYKKIAFFCILATDRQTNKQMDSTDALSRSRCRQRRLKNYGNRCRRTGLCRPRGQSLIESVVLSWGESRAPVLMLVVDYMQISWKLSRLGAFCSSSRPRSYLLPALVLSIVSCAVILCTDTTHRRTDSGFLVLTCSALCISASCHPFTRDKQHTIGTSGAVRLPVCLSVCHRDN